MKKLKEIIKSQNCVISVMGDHAGESTEYIFNRKMKDILNTGLTYWLIRSHKAKPSDIQAINRYSPTYAIFIEASSKVGARPTLKEEQASEYSVNFKSWYNLPYGIGPVTGKMGKSTSAMVFDEMTTDVDGVIDLWEFAEFSEEKSPIRFALGSSTVCATRFSTSNSPLKMKSRYRRIIAVARFVEPYAVYLR